MNTSSEISEEFFNDKIDSRVNFKDVVHRYLKYWRWFTLSIIVAIAVGFLFAKLQVPEYKIDIAILIKDKQSNGDKDLLDQLNLNSSDKIIDNEIQILKTNMLMEKVISALDLGNTYVIENNFTKYTLYNKYCPFKIKLLSPSSQISTKKWIVRYINPKEIEFDGKVIPFNHPVQTAAGLIIATPNNVAVKIYQPIHVIFGTVEGTAQNYISKLVITPASKLATVLFISMEDEIPERGKDILTRLVDEYNQMSIDDKNKTTSNTLNFIESRLSVVASELNSVEKNVANYKSSNNIVDISSQSSIFLANVQTNDAQITKIDLEIGALKNLESYLKSGTNDLSKLPSMLGVDDPTLLGLVTQLAQALTEKEGRLRTIPETNPIVNSINDQIQSLKSTILKTVVNVNSGLIDSKRQLQNKNASYNSLIKGVPSKEKGLIDVMRDRDIKNNLFTFLLQKREETQISLASTVSDSKTIDKAKSSGMFFKPAKNIIYITFFFIGLLIPFFIIYLKDSLNSTVRRRQDIEGVTRIPIIAQLGYSKEPNTMVVINQPRSMISEQIRALRTNLDFILPGVKRRNLLFTSSISGEGKSFVCLNLGASLASTGKKVVVLELDLRKPRFHVSLGLENDKGLSGYLIGRDELKDIIKIYPEQPNLSIISSGAIPPNPAELLLNGRIESLLDKLNEEFDYVLMDAPPIGLLTDAQILSKHADATLFVIRHSYTHKDSVNLLEEFRKKGFFKNLNIVFNSINTDKNGYGYGYGYGYGDSYGYGYYVENNDLKKNWFSWLKNRN
ncbi:GumC family protein [Mucilaginibacter jinjuensis]|uniref:non-specific protein-tyrosine kinase n=1 Tax=Mucilaginibacter jinjuensis TaxID=1176721 RepID=A0ABY7TC91_9SPHI|nr:tyrosine-protein kinase [Mucilaginibacter jinjuensis]WCT13828.1 polysaccharide biosynthesis tyrosine autokinase [Mucilaginibacter jinjuensis]